MNMKKQDTMNAAKAALLGITKARETTAMQPDPIEEDKDAKIALLEKQLKEKEKELLIIEMGKKERKTERLNIVMTKTLLLETKVRAGERNLSVNEYVCRAVAAANRVQKGGNNHE